MPHVVVRRHGDRWAVAELDAEGATKEFATREAAEAAARGLAGGETVEVHEDDFGGLSESGPSRPREHEAGGPTGAPGPERARSPQSGL